MAYRDLADYNIIDRGFTPVQSSTPILSRRAAFQDISQPFDWSNEEPDRSDAYRMANAHESFLNEARLTGQGVLLDMLPNAPPSLEPANISDPTFAMSTIEGDGFQDLDSFEDSPTDSERLWDAMEKEAADSAHGSSPRRSATYRIGDVGRTYDMGSPGGRGESPSRTYNLGPPTGETYNLGSPTRATYNLGSPRRNADGSTYILGPPTGATYNLESPTGATYNLGSPTGATYNLESPTGATYNLGSPTRATYNLGSPRRNADGSTYNLGSPDTWLDGRTYDIGSPTRRDATSTLGGDQPSLLTNLAMEMVSDTDIYPENSIKVEEVVEGPKPHHTFVPSWVYMARKQYPVVFENSVDFYFTNMRWPKFHELPPWFMQVCWTTQVTPEKYERSSGFAPIWVYVLKMMCDEELLERHWFTACINSFFEDGAFPDLDAFPEELENHCAELGIDENNFYAKDP